jgi:hypothetical protein
MAGSEVGANLEVNVSSLVESESIFGVKEASVLCSEFRLVSSN